MNPLRGDFVKVGGPEVRRGCVAVGRGLATTLFRPGVPAEIAQVIPRHEDVATTQAHYVKLSASIDGVKAMKKLGRSVGQKWGRKTRRVRRTSLRPA